MAITVVNEKTNEAVPIEESVFAAGLPEESVSIIEYVEQEMAPLYEKGFTVVDSLVLSQLSYMNFSGVVPGVEQFGLSIPLQQLYRAEYFSQYTDDTLMPKKNRQLLNAVCASPRFRDIRMNYFTESIDEIKEQQFCAMTFFLPTGEVYVAFRGTDTSINGWKEDFNMFFLDIIPGQISALEYLKTVAARTDASIYVGGHSKGGNLAMYAASFAGKGIQDRIIAVFNHDGPGITKGAMAKPEFSDITSKINITLPRSSIIGLLFSHGNYTVIKSDRVGILQHDPFSWEIVDGEFIYYREVKPGANNLTDAVYELMETLSEEDRQLFVDTVFDLINVAGATTFSEFPLMAMQSRDKIMEALKNLDAENREKVKLVFSELIKIVARKSFRIPESEIGVKLNERMNRLSEATDRIAEKVTEATEKISETKDRLTERITESAARISETTVKISDTIEKARQILKKDETE